jgi:pilus assembly protein TadC
MSSVVPLALGAAWGVIAASPLARRARQREVVARLASDEPTPRRVPTAVGTAREQVRTFLATGTGPVGRVVVGVRARRTRGRCDAALSRELPVTIDLLAVAVGAGCTPFVAVEVAAQWAPPACAAQLHSVRRSCSLGSSFAASLDEIADREPLLRPVADALLASDRYGAPVGDALARLAKEERTALRRRGEARARTVPVRLLFPLVFLVLPAFGLLTVAPALLAGFARH